MIVKVLKEVFSLSHANRWLCDNPTSVFSIQNVFELDIVVDAGTNVVVVDIGMTCHATIHHRTQCLRGCLVT